MMQFHSNEPSERESKFWTKLISIILVLLIAFLFTLTWSMMDVWFPVEDPEVQSMIQEAKESNSTELWLGHSSITDISPLADMIKLEALGLGKNYITDISPLAGLKNLKELYLFDNKISYISPLAGLTNLEVLTLFENPIPDNQKTLLKKALPNTKIEFDRPPKYK
jgi:Leucine-rich repeat (LRR) protein